MGGWGGVGELVRRANPSVSGPYVTLPVRAGATLMASVSHLSLTGVEREGGGRGGAVTERAGLVGRGYGGGSPPLCKQVNRLIHSSG